MPDQNTIILDNADHSNKAIHIRYCSLCGHEKFVIRRIDYRLLCDKCREPFQFEDQPENLERKSIRDRIDKSLGMLAELFPLSLQYSVDEEGMELLRTTLQACQGDVRLTDFGGGPLTTKHLEIVFAHCGHAEIAVWLSDPGDVGLIRAACAAANATLHATASC